MALSSITKKLIMSISGLFLIVFLLLHMTINFFSVIDSFTGKYGAADGLFQAGCAGNNTFGTLLAITIGRHRTKIYNIINSYKNNKT